ncbi:MerR family transcriptional regulator [Maridesulfovibrio sp.]|uniref:MerR family transcriptional regulator n=1 Tax=Maridesulfovibrio sp. TaxID=2795000 RepID=UPI002A1893B7|nr:MerR family transcriptional regulator [Maridesulfovibrio sp.]
MPDKKLLSIAEISRLLEVPESTLHYWKNRFAQYLPSSGHNRQKRFRPEALEAFRLISAMLKQGHTAEDVMAELSRRYPVNVSVDQGGTPPELPGPTSGQPTMEAAVQMAAAMGSEIAKSINDGLKGLMACIPAQTMLPDELQDSMDQTARNISEQGEALKSLKSENTELREKLAVMEAELIRLRKDRREMEKYLLDKLKGVTN